MTLELRGIDAFYGRSQILHGVRLRVEPGEVVALLGRNGAGKTSTIAATIGFLRARSGTVSLGERRLERLPSYRRVRAGLGCVPQSGRLFAGLTVRENLEIARRRNGRRNGAPDWGPERAFEAFPALRRLEQRDAGMLSGGERQMLAVARALMLNPSQLLLDEPSEGLAPVIVQTLGEVIGALREQGVGVLLAEQNHRFALGVASRAYVIEKGRIRHEAAAGELADPAEVERYLGV